MKKKLMYVAPMVATGLTSIAPMVSYATETGSAGSAVTESVSLVTSVASLFSSYPMNVFLGLGLAAAALGLLAKAIRTAKR